MPVPGKIIDLVERFSQNIDSYKSGNYNETQVRREFIDPFFEALGWDVANTKGYAEAYKDVIHEYSLKTKEVVKAPDYLFKIGGIKKFFVEAKKPSVNLKNDISPAFQLRRYAWSAKLQLSILTDFEEFAVYDCRIQPKKTDKSSTARIHYFTFEEYIEKWDEIESIFSREAILKGSFDKFAESKKGKRGTAEVDDAFLKEIENWRTILARNIALRNSTLTNRELNYAVQKTIDRIIFLRICEDRGIEEYGQLMNLQSITNVYRSLLQIFTRANEKYNSGLFHFDKENGRYEPHDEITPLITIDDKALKEIIKNLYYPDSPYEFSVLAPDILGHVYEQFLGKIIRLTPSHQAKIEEKPEVKKAGGVYYTPTYIVDYIVKNTLGKLLDEIFTRHSGLDPESKNKPSKSHVNKAVKEVSKLKILDPACGSGSFLIGAYQYLLDWHLKTYIASNEMTQRVISTKQSPIYQAKKDEYRLTTNEKKRILLNNIFGVDIDSQAVEVTKLSLLLKVLEGESDESITTQLSMFRERALPDLSNNIKCGNSLIGPDFYDQVELDLDDEERFKINVFDWETEFKEIVSSGGFDCVIGNPPYVRQELIKANKKYFQDKYFVFNSTADLYQYFIEMGIRILNNNGAFGFIVANKWMRANYGNRLREFLANQSIQEIIDFRDLKVFGSVNTYPSILLINNSISNREFFVTNVLSLKFSSLSEYISENKFLISKNNLNPTTWSLLKPEKIALLQRLVSNFSTLKETMQDKLYVGLKTGLNEAFILNKETAEKIRKEAPFFVKNYAVGRDVKRYNQIKATRYILLIPSGWSRANGIMNFTQFSDRFPNLSKHLAKFSEKAKLRSDQGDFWWEMRSCTYYEKFEKPKIVFSEIAKRGQFTLDTSECFLDMTLFFMPSSSDYLLGVLNSKLITFYFSHISSEIKGNFLRWKRQYVERIPIVALNEENDITINLKRFVNEIISLNNKFDRANLPQEKTALQRQINSTDKQIDKLVYKLYDLTEEEIKIVEESFS